MGFMTLLDIAGSIVVGAFVILMVPVTVVCQDQAVILEHGK